MNHLKSVLKIILSISDFIHKKHIPAYAAQSSFFLVLSFFPMVSLIITLIKLNGGVHHSFTSLVVNILPYINKDYITSILEDFSFRPSSVISLSTLVAAWSSGKSFYALSEAFSTILDSKRNRGYFALRLRSLVFSFAFAICVALLFFIGVFGGKITESILFCFPRYPYFVHILRNLFIVFILFSILSLIDVFLPEKKTKENIKYCLLSSFASSCIIYVYTVLFSLFSGIYIKYSSFYGSIATFISAMLWIYGSMYIIILGFGFVSFLNRNFMN
ncbi:MAG: YihY/virulence factor BrkB family protein [Clostridia bacterium]|nr:YihY/virulence factor BrkB family protein [Clostridia bacterium]